ncbi:hypothetical protein D1007_38310 [Hordeum vulgare]|nr:hypothetical protein D1007_38310 [Hordeum vulgare]
MSLLRALPRLVPQLTCPRRPHGGGIARTTVGMSGGALRIRGAVMRTAARTGAPPVRRVRTGAGTLALLGACPQRPRPRLPCPSWPRLRRRSQRRRRSLLLFLGVLAAQRLRGLLSRRLSIPPPPARASRQRSPTRCASTVDALVTSARSASPPPPPAVPHYLAYLGYGTELGSFYFVDAEIEEEAARPHLATVTLAPDQATPIGLLIMADLIRAELAAYIGDFRDSDFACEAAAAEPDPVPPLEKVWVLVYGLPRGGCAAPRGGKLAHILKAISETVGKLITADLASFEDDGPARIEILCPAPAEIDGLSLVFYFGTKGRRLTFELESPAPVDPLGPAEVVPEPGDGGLDDEGALRRRIPLLRVMVMMEGLRLHCPMAGATLTLWPLDRQSLQGTPRSLLWCR